jgi:glycerol-3-phosphate acyltransferase PlsY
MNILLLALLGYGIGSLPFSFLVARLFGVKDVRAVGSGNVGATNVMRSAGMAPGIAALLLDGSKGALSVLLARLVSSSESEVCLAGLMAVIGHLFPVWLGFRGGKGVATGAGLFIPLAPAALGVSIGIFLLTLGVFRFVSLASMAASLALPAAAHLMGASMSVTLTAVAAASMVIAKHHGNIGRLWRGVEPRLGRKG